MQRSKFVFQETAGGQGVDRSKRRGMEKRDWHNVRRSPSYFAATCVGAPPGKKRPRSNGKLTNLRGREEHRKK